MIEKWKKTLLKPDQSIREALAVLEGGSAHIGLIVDDMMTLLGIITDGDIRRAILRGVTLECPVSDFMNKTPLTIPSNATRAEAVRIMEHNQILAVPILAGKTLTGLETLLKNADEQKYANAIFLMAGGFGTRLRPLTDSCPKPMLKIGGKPILENLICKFKKAGFYNFYISIHYLPKIITDYFGNGSKWDVNINYIYEKVPLGTGGALGLLPDDIAELPIIVSNGDLLTQVDFERLLKFHEKHKSDATMCVRDYSYQVPFGVVTGKGSKITEIVEKPNYRHFVNAGIYVLEKKILRHVKKDNKMNMPDFFNQMIKLEKNVFMFPIHEYWMDIGRIDDFKKAQNDILDMQL